MKKGSIFLDELVLKLLPCSIRRLGKDIKVKDSKDKPICVSLGLKLYKPFKNTYDVFDGEKKIGFLSFNFEDKRVRSLSYGLNIGGKVYSS